MRHLHPQAVFTADQSKQEFMMLEIGILLVSLCLGQVAMAQATPAPATQGKNAAPSPLTRAVQASAIATETTPGVPLAALRSGPPPTSSWGARPYKHEAVAGLLAGVLSIPLAAQAASSLGRGPRSLIGAALPAALLYLALPPLAVDFAVFGVGRWLGDSGARWSPSLWLTLATHLLVFVSGVGLGLSTDRVGDLVALTVVDSALMAGVGVLTLHWGTP